MSERDNLCVSFDNLYVPNQIHPFGNEHLSIKRVILDECVAGFQFVTR